MENNWASEHLQVIRTLMERSAVYRRALAPIMTSVGLVGILAAAGGSFLKIGSPRGFTVYWMGVSLAALALAFALVRRQALKDAEPFWSPPTRRVTQALLPPLFVGLMAGVFLGLPAGSSAIPVWWLPSIWMVLYGCAVHAAGFFMPRGMKLFGWGFVLAGGGCFWRLSQWPDAPSLLTAHAVMGGAFGVLHLTYGIYLYFTEKRRATT